MLGVQETRGSPEAHAERRHDRPATLVPRPDQVEAVEAVLERLESGGTRTQLRKACGTGKTLDGVKVLEGLDQPTNLLLFPSLGLIAQTLDVHRAQASTSRDYLVVCSDPSVVRRVSDDAAHYTSEDLGIQVTSDPAIVRQFLSSGSGQKVVLGTYQSGEVIAEAQKAMRLGGRASAFGFAAFDEAHHCTGIEGGQFTRPLDDAFIHADRRLFMTATPRIYTERAKSRCEVAGKSVFSMDDPLHFGEVAYSLPLSRAIGMGLLTPYEVLVVAVNEKEIPGLTIEAGKPMLRGRDVAESDLHLLASYVAIQKAMVEFDLKRVITFHASVSRAKQFADHTRRDSFHASATALSERFGTELWTQAVDGAMPASERKELLGRMRSLPAGMRAVFSNCRCLGEGVDVPTLDAVCFVDERQSVTDLVQAVGRAIRKAPDKHVGRVVLPVFVPSGANLNEVMESSAFRKVWRVLRAVQAHDDTLADTLDAVRSSGRAAELDIVAGEQNLPIRLSGGEADSTLLRQLNRAISVTVIERFAPRHLTEALIKEWILLEHKVTLAWPRGNHGKIQVEGVDETWSRLDSALNLGFRGLPGGRKLADLVDEVRNSVGDPMTRTLDEVRDAVRESYVASGKKVWPSPKHKTPVPGGRFTSWSALDAALFNGSFGLPGEMRLADVVQELKAEFGISDVLHVETIKRWIIEHHQNTKAWPRGSRSPVQAEVAVNETWLLIDKSLREGCRGLPPGGSLKQLVDSLRRAAGEAVDLSIGLIKEWMIAEFLLTKRWPTRVDGEIKAPGATPNTWAAVSQAMKSGGRGLPPTDFITLRRLAQEELAIRSKS